MERKKRKEMVVGGPCKRGRLEGGFVDKKEDKRIKIKKRILLLYFYYFKKLINIGIIK